MDLESAFEEHRRELHVHCYRMLASYDDAEDAVQETYLRAWQARDTFDGEHLRAWLYRIATNTCIDRTRSRARRPPESPAEVPWLTAYPDDALGPDATYAERETVELAFLVALQALPGRQRAAFLGREVLGLSAAETASLVGASVPATNSALQRARETMKRRLPRHRADWQAPTPDPDEKRLLAAFIDAHERCDAAAALAVAASDIRVTMPPQPLCFDGRDALAPLLERAFGSDREGDWRLLPTSANRMPAAVSYLRRPGDSLFRAFKVDVLRVVHGEIAEITTVGPALFVAYGMPETIND
jgi:RNA polymerase sigma-70 factor (ECF subfamily)